MTEEARMARAPHATPIGLHEHRSETQTSVATADKTFDEPAQFYPDKRDKDTGLGEAGFRKPGDEVVRSPRHAARLEASR